MMLTLSMDTVDRKYHSLIHLNTGHFTYKDAFTIDEDYVQFELLLFGIIRCFQKRLLFLLYNCHKIFKKVHPNTRLHIL